MDQHLEFEQPIYTCLEKIEQLKKIKANIQNSTCPNRCATNDISANLSNILEMFGIVFFYECMQINKQ